MVKSLFDKISGMLGGEKADVQTITHPNGAPAIVTRTVKGQKHGENADVWYSTDGRVTFSADYNRGVIVKSRRYDSNTYNMREEKTFDDKGLEHGVINTWDADGNPTYTTNYVHGEKQGEEIDHKNRRIRIFKDDRVVDIRELVQKPQEENALTLSF